MPPELPAHQERVRASVAAGLPRAPALSPAELASLRERLAKRLAPVAATLRPGAEVLVDRYRLGAAVCPASGVSQPFEWIAPFAARTLGIAALRQMLGPARLGALDAVGVAIEDAIAEDGSVGRWLASQEAPARGATVASVATWASRSWVAVPWARLGAVHLSERANWARFAGAGSQVTLKGRPDAVIRPLGRGPGEVVLASVRSPGNGIAGLDALAFSLQRGFVPLRVVSVQASSGNVEAADVDAAMLEVAADAVVAVAGALAPLADGAPAAEVPGRQCWSCARRHHCPSGIAWTQAHPRRVGGIPLGAA